MTHLVEAVALDSAGGDRQFTIRFDISTGVDSHGLRQFVIITSRGTVTLEPLELSYAATFGMCSVFASDIRAVQPRID